MEQVEGIQDRKKDAETDNKQKEGVLDPDNRQADTLHANKENILEDKTRSDSPEIKKDTGNEKEPVFDLEEKDIEEVKANENVEDKAVTNTGKNAWQDGEETDRSAQDGSVEEDKNKEEEESKGKSLEEAILEQRQKEKEAFQKLIDENVKLSKDALDMEAKMNQAQAQENTLRVELQTEREKTEELKTRIKEVETEIDTEKKNKSSMLDPTENGEGPSEKEKYEKKIKDLQTRLKRMAKDEEEKDQRNDELDNQLKNKDEHIHKLEQYVDKAKVDEIRASQQKDERKNENKTNTDTVVSNAVREPDVRRSKTCTIM